MLTDPDGCSQCVSGDRPRGTRIFPLALLAALLLTIAVYGQPATTIPQQAVPAEPVPVKVVHPVPTSDTTLAAVWMAGISGVLALGSAGLQAYTSRRSTLDKMLFDAELIKLRMANETCKEESKRCEERAEKLEAEIVELRTRLAAAEAQISKLRG